MIPLEAVYKGATRPAMKFGIPLVPLVILFGTAMLEGFHGDKAAATRDRDRALALDPAIPDWVEKTFRFPIADFYRRR